MDAVNGTVWTPTVVQSWTWQAICKIILAVVGILGNSLVIAVYRGKKKQKDSTNVMILALACADLVSSINFIPQPTLLRVPNNVWGELYCRLIFSQAFLWISIEASVYTLTLLSVERYLAVVHPIRYRNVFTKSKPKRFIWVIWLFAVIVKSFNFYITTIVEGGGCEYVSFAAGFNLLIAVGVALIEYFIPIAVMTFCNVRALKALRAQAHTLQGSGVNATSGPATSGPATSGPATSGPSTSGPATRVLQTRRRLMHVVLFVILTFIICWTPDQISLLLMNLGILPFEHFNGNLHQSFVILAFFNSCANPIIYTFKNKQFRTSVFDLFRRKSNRVTASTVTHVSTVAGGSNPAC